MIGRFLSLGATLVVCAFLMAPRSEAGPDPRAFVGELGNQGIQALGSGVPRAQRVAKFRELFESDFDVSDIGRFAIGRYWRAYNPDQQQEFLRLFGQYTAVAYADRLKEYGGAQFEVTGVQTTGNEVVVSSQVARANGQPVQIDWHLIDRGGQYKVTDVYVDRVSMKITQRDEFAKVIENNGGRPEAVLAVLRQNLREDRNRQL